jgi:hypothetical protein
MLSRRRRTAEPPRVRACPTGVTALLLGLALLLLHPTRVPGQVPDGRPEYQYDVKAAFLYHFTRYLQWPETDRPEAFTIAVLGKSGITAPLLKISEMKTVGPLRIEVRPCSRIEEIGHPRILFIAESASHLLPQALEKTRGTDILTVSELEGPRARGVAINFVLRNETIKFEIDEKVLKEARIQASSQLLRLAILVNRG